MPLPGILYREDIKNIHESLQNFINFALQVEANKLFLKLNRNELRLRLLYKQNSNLTYAESIFSTIFGEKTKTTIKLT